MIKMTNQSFDPFEWIEKKTQPELDKQIDKQAQKLLLTDHLQPLHKSWRNKDNLSACKI